MSATKINSRYGILAKPEASYLAGATVSAATDGVLVVENPTVSPQFAHDGSRNGKYGTFAPTPNAAKSGMFAQFPLTQEFIGPGAAYSATSVPTIDTLMKFSGYAATLTAGTSIAYSPAADTATPTSGALEVYSRGQKAVVNGAYLDLEVASDGPGVPKWTFTVNGKLVSIADAAVPAITYAQAQTLPPKSTGLGLTIGGVSTFKVRGWTFKLSRTIAARVDDNSTGHGGFTPAERAATLEVDVEAESLGTYDAYNNLANAVQAAIGFTVGATALNKVQFSAPKAQLVAIDDSDDGPSAVWKLTFRLLPSTFGGVDDHTWTSL